MPFKIRQAAWDHAQSRNEKWQLQIWAPGGFLKPQHNRTVPLARQQPLYSVVPDPIAFPVSKALKAACPRQDTQGGGVVNEAKKPIVVA